MNMDRIIKKKKWPLQRIIKYSAIGIFVMIIIYLLVFRSGGSTLNVRQDRITISIVKEGYFQEFIPIIGTIIPVETIYLDAEEGGRIEKIFKEAGSKVRKGDKILELSNTNLLLDIMYREAELFQQSNNLRNTRLMFEQNRLELERQLMDIDYNILSKKRKYKRNKVLFAEKLISRQDYEEIKDEYEYLVKKRSIIKETQEKDLHFRIQQIKHLEVSLKRMQDNLHIVKKKLENLTIRAPISGHLTSLNAEIGESKSPGQRLGQVDVINGFRVNAEIDEHYINRIEENKTGEFDFSGKSYRLIVKKIYPEVKDGKFEVDLEFDGTEPAGIRRGQTLHIRLQLSDMARAILLSRGGFYQTTGGNWVYILEGSGDFAVKRRIKLGRQNPRYFEVLEGLDPGDKVITSSYENFNNMDRLVLK